MRFKGLSGDVIEIGKGILAYLAQQPVSLVMPWSTSTLMVDVCNIVL